MSKRSEEAACKYTGLQHPPTDDSGVLTAADYYAFLDGYEQAEKDIKERLLELIEEEEKFWDDGEIIFSKLKKELNEL